MAIDDPIDQYDQQTRGEGSKLPNTLANYAAQNGLKLAFPDGGMVASVLGKAGEVLFGKQSTAKRVEEDFNLLVGEIRYIQKTKVSQDDLQQAFQLYFFNDRRDRDDKKRERYIKLIGNALRSEEQIHDVASFVRTIEQLNERDIAVLRVINTVMNQQGDWKPQQQPGGATIMKLHPSIINGRSQELAVQIALALEQKTERNTFNREEGFGICNRLQGFGLVYGVERDRELPLSNYSFRLSSYGVRLLKLLGTDVPNYGCYFPADL